MNISFQEFIDTNGYWPADIVSTCRFIRILQQIFFLLSFLS